MSSENDVQITKAIKATKKVAKKSVTNSTPKTVIKPVSGSSIQQITRNLVENPVENKVIIENTKSDKISSNMQNTRQTKVSRKKITQVKKANVINDKEGQNNQKLKMIDLCAGTGAFSYAFIQTNFVDVVYANDMEESSKKIYDLNFNHRLTLRNICDEKVENIPSHDILTAGFPCFVAGTKVLTHFGYKNIEDVTLMDKLMTHTGKFQQILNLQKKNYSGQLYHIKTWHHSSIIKCTDEHPFFVRERYMEPNNESECVKYKYSNPVWKPAKELTRDMFFGMKLNINSLIPEFNFINKKNENAEITLNNKDYWLILGYFMGNGWFEKNNAENAFGFNVNNADNDVMDVIRKYITIKYIKINEMGYMEIHCNDFIWYNIFSSFHSCNCAKIIPKWILDAPPYLVKEFVNGYEKCKGYTSHEHCKQIYASSYDLAYGLQLLYLKLGNIMSIDMKTINQCNIYTIKDNMDVNDNYSAFIYDEYVWYPCESIRHIEAQNVSVYNFEVDEDNSYIVENIIAHNCQPFSIAGKQKGFGDPRSNVFWKIIEIIKYHKPECVILENVKNIFSHDNGDTFKTIKSSLEKENYSIIYKILNTSTITEIPHHRERIYIVCVKNKKVFDNFNLDFAEVTQQSIKNYLELPNSAISDKYYYNNKESKIHKMIMETVDNEETVYQYRRTHVRKNKSNECPTLTANMGGGGHNVPIIKDNKGQRKLTPRECFNFQGFPKTYNFPKLSDSKLYKLAGNAVSIPVVQLIANKLVPEIISHK